MHKITVVDDDRDIRELIEIILSQAGFQVNTAADGEAALKSIKENPPDLILLDVRLPGMSGYDVCRRIKQEPMLVDIPVVFLTARGQLEEIREGLEAGAVEYYLKPFSPKELIEKIQALVPFYT